MYLDLLVVNVQLDVILCKEPAAKNEINEKQLFFVFIK